MPVDKKTSPERPRRPGSGPAVSQRPARPAARPASDENARRSEPLSQPPGKGPRNRPTRRRSWKAVWENIGWGLVIGLPVILVILAIVWRTTNGFQGTGPADVPIPTPVPSPTAGVYLAPPAVSGSKDRVLYLQAANAASPMQIFSSNLDGTNPVQLTNSRENKAGLAWSPDGKQAAFTADGVGVQLLNYDGSGLHTVAYGAYNPVWSPDGKQLAFLKNSPAPDGKGPDGTGTVRVLYVTKIEAKPGDERQLVADALGQNWSPDSKAIAFFSLRNAVMFTVDVESGKVAQVRLADKIGGWYPTFAPNGPSLVFYGNPNPSVMVNSLDLAVASANIDPTGGPGVAATATANAAAGITASPAATGALAPGATTTPGTPTATAVPGPVSQMSLYSVNLDGSNLKKLQDLEPAGGTGGGRYRFSYYVATSADLVQVLTARPYYKVGPVFAPDGQSVAVLYVGQGEKIGQAVVRLDGSPATLLVEGENGLEAGQRLNPAFAPDNTRLLYTFVPPANANQPTPTPGANVMPSTAAPLKQGRFYSFNEKAEKTVVGQGDVSYLACCGLVKR